MVRPLVTPIDERDRELYGQHESRYKVAKTMQPFDAPISEHDRNLFGEYQPRYQVKKQMQPFDAGISERERELYGEFESRYYQPKEYQPFGASIDDYKRELYGDYRSRYSRLKVGLFAGGFFAGCNGLNWVTINTSPAAALKPTTNDIALYQIYFFILGAPAGTLTYRVLVDGVKVYPFEPDEDIVHDTWQYLGTLSTAVKTGEECVVQFRSDNAGDGAATEVVSFMRYAELREV